MVLYEIIYISEGMGGSGTAFVPHCFYHGNKLLRPKMR
jgi:hypothetical protein